MLENILFHYFRHTLDRLGETAQEIKEIFTPEQSQAVVRPEEDPRCVSYAMDKARLHQMYGATRFNDTRFQSDYSQCLVALRATPVATEANGTLAGNGPFGNPRALGLNLYFDGQK
jgi:hypothetical protein